jgi:transposase InsO family protein
LPHIDSLLDRLAGSSIFSTLDVAAAYWNIPLAEESKEKTAFRAGNKLYQFKVLPFGLSGAPATFQRLMLDVIGDLDLVPYIDDVVVPSKTVNEHLLVLEASFERLRLARMKLKPSKCRFGKRRISYLGFTVENGCLSPNGDKIKGIVDFATPTEPVHLQRFLGMCQFYARFIPRFAVLALPLTSIQSCAKAKFQWSATCQTSFDRIKTAFANVIRLSQPDFSKKFIIDCDASDHALGAVLYQEGDGLPISFASRKLGASERNYSATDKEFLALVWAIKHFRPYVHGVNFQVVTDHLPLLTLVKAKAHNGRQARWQMFLEEFTFDLRYRPGKQNIVADALSRSILNAEADEFIPDIELIAPSMAVPDPDCCSLQKGDDFCQSIIKVLARGGCKNGYNCDSSGALRYYGRLVLPHSKVQQFIDTYHFQGHFSPANTRRALLGAGYWFPRMRSLITARTSSCSGCSKRSYAQFRLPNIALPKAPEVQPFEFVAIDIVGQLPMAKSGYCYLLTIVDHATRWMEAVPMTNIRAETCVTAFLEQWVYRFGPPATLHSDRGAQFVSSVFDSLCSRFGIRRSMSTPFHPEGNSVLERCHRTLKDRLRAQGGAWLEDLRAAVFDVNRMATGSDGPSAFETVFQRPAVIPADWPSRNRHRFSEVENFPRVGSWVARRVAQPQSSLAPRFMGRWRVAARPTTHTARLEDDRSSVVNVRDLRMVD